MIGTQGRIRFFYTIAALGVLGAFSVWLIAERAEARIESYTFSNTQHWDSNLQDEYDGGTHLPVGWQEHITLPFPPENTSEQTKVELEALLSYRNLRTEETQKDIEQEIEGYEIIFAGAPLDTYFSKVQYPYTSELLNETYPPLRALILHLKAEFDRVRPHILEKAISPTIEVPGHPAYPSGHATEAYFFAEIFSLLAPEKHEELLKSANRVARHREIAGVHYPSDTEAGKVLALQYARWVQEDPRIAELIEEAKKEW